MGAMEQQIRFCRAADGVMLAYARVGSGPPLIKAANWLSHLEHDWKTPIWRPLLERLAAHNTVIRYDERGCGLSDWEVEDLSFESWVRDLEAVADAARVDRFPLLGISQGGPVAIAYAARHPERVSRLILYGTYLRGRLRRDPGPREREEAEALVKLVRAGWGRENPAYRQLFSSIFLPDATLEQMRAFTELQRLSTSPENAARIVSGFDQVDVSELAPELDVPTLVLHVRGDGRIPFEEGRRVAAGIRGARFVPLEGRNHGLLPEDLAFEPFLEEVRRFLAEDEDGEAARATPGDVIARVDRMTPREREVLELVARGLDNAAIAGVLAIQPKTVRNHVSVLFAKLGAGHRAEAVVMAREAGFGRGGD
jgi:pimeloyl-ACP methyl ester carboxylesterase/DNA-binding CsgD family transcriptional regulator